MLAFFRQLALGGRVLALQLAHDQEDHQHDHDDREQFLVGIDLILAGIGTVR